MKRAFTSLSRQLAATALALSAGAALAAGPDAPRETIVPAFVHALANVPGKTATALVVSYAPGGTTPAHRHGSAFVIGYVLEGAIRSQVDGGPVQVFRAGESWTELPGAHHTVSDNASATEPAKLLAIFIADTQDKDLLSIDKH